MELHLYFAFVVATTIMILLPGPSVLLTIAHSISFGWQRGMSTVSVATVGVAVQLIVAAIGLTTLLHAVAEVFEWLRWAGAIYLVYLGFKQWRSARMPLEFGNQTSSRTNLFVQGLVITIPNPKSLIFIAAFLLQFIDTTHPIGLQLTLIVPTFFVITFTVTSVWAVVAGNYTFDYTREDAEVLGRMAKIARQAGAGFISAAKANLLGCESLAETPDPDDWQGIPDKQGSQAWEALRELPEAPYLGLALPRFLLRLPYGEDTDPTERFEFEEMTSDLNHEDYLWGNPCFACAYSHSGPRLG